MSSPARRAARMSVEEYLRREESATVRHEYVAGEVYAMTGTTLRHNRIAANLLVRLRAAAAGGPCQVFMSDVKVRAADDVFYYPDVVVVCGPVRDMDVTVDAPCLVAEVTSRSTARVDRGEKLVAYRAIASLAAYLVVDQSRRRVQRHWRDAEGAWREEELTGAESLAVPCPPTTLTLDDIYEGVDVTVGEPEADTYDA